jgi:hypothetical protein
MTKMVRRLQLGILKTKEALGFRSMAHNIDFSLCNSDYEEQ